VRSLLSRLTLPALAAIAVVSLLVALSVLDAWLVDLACAYRATLCQGGNGISDPEFAAAPRPQVVLLVVSVLAVIGLGAGLLIRTNRFSLHAMYRARLIRAYLGASRPAGERRPDPFTGFDEADNLQLACVGLERDSPLASKRPPFHVINIALNLVGGRNLAWQDRKAESFTVTPLHAGAMQLGYRRTRLETPMEGLSLAEDPRYYGGDRGISLGTALTISGAAASPNMGYHSSPAVTFLMALFNARLGCWLGNPGANGEDTFHLSSPQQALRPFIDEMFGRTDDTNGYVYLSDGGHFENLGLYEMVLRRCRLVIVSDASCDEECSLQDLGNAIRKIRIDLGVPIEFSSDFKIRKRRDDPSAPPGRYWALGRIRYSCVDRRWETSKGPDSEYDGVLLYVKPGLYGGEPRDVFNYASVSKAFPHESTADQFFSEEQFESYRILGSHAVDSIAAELEMPLSELFTEEGRLKVLTHVPHVPAGAGGPRHET